MYRVSPQTRLLALLLSAVVVLSALGGAGLALAPLLSADQRPAWLLFGFEGVVLSAGVMGLIFGRGGFGSAPGLALACIAGTVFLGSAMGWQAAGRQVAGVSLTPFLGVRLLMALALAAAGAVCVLSRDRRSWRLALVGGGLAVPVLGAAALVALPAGRRMLESALGTSTGVQATVGVLAFLILGGMLCASVHLIVRAFELGRAETPPTSSRSA